MAFINADDFKAVVQNWRVVPITDVAVRQKTLDCEDGWENVIENPNLKGQPSIAEQHHYCDCEDSEIYGDKNIYGYCANFGNLHTPTLIRAHVHPKHAQYHL